MIRWTTDSIDEGFATQAAKSSRFPNFIRGGMLNRWGGRKFGSLYFKPEVVGLVGGHLPTQRPSNPAGLGRALLGCR